MKSFAWTIFSTVFGVIVMILFGLGVALYNGRYKVAGTQVCIDVNSGQLRELQYVIGLRTRERIQDTEVSRIAKANGLVQAPPLWVVAESKTVLSRVSPYYELSAAPTGAKMIEKMIKTFKLGASEQMLLATLFLQHLQARNISGLQIVLQKKFLEYQESEENVNSTRQP